MTTIPPDLLAYADQRIAEAKSFVLTLVEFVGEVPADEDSTPILSGLASRLEQLRRDAPIRYVRGNDRCGFCGELSPCVIHQPRAAAGLEHADDA